MPGLASPAFPDDDGRADPALAAALRQHASRRSSGAVLHALCAARLLVPVVAVATTAEPATEQTPSGLRTDKETDMSAVMMRGRDGRRALLAFASLNALTAWDATARPVPVTAAGAARSARVEGAAALLIDVAGPAPFVVQDDDLDQLAAGRLLVPVGSRYGWVATG